MAAPERSLSQEELEALDFEIAFYEGILERNPEAMDVLMALGHDYTQRGLFEKGLGIDERLCAMRARDPIAHYNLACSYCLLGRVDDAVRAVRHAIQLGYGDLAHMEQDPDLENLRHDPRYVAIVEELARRQLAR